MMQLVGQMKIWNSCSPIYHDGALLRSTYMFAGSRLPYSWAYTINHFNIAMTIGGMYH